jgi:hypothetical protein
MISFIINTVAPPAAIQAIKNNSKPALYLQLNANTNEITYIGFCF